MLFLQKMKFRFHHDAEVALGPLALLFAFKGLGLQGESGTQDSSELFSTLPNFSVLGGPDHWFPNLSMQTIS